MYSSFYNYSLFLYADFLHFIFITESLSKSTERSSSGSAHAGIVRNIIDGAGDGHMTNADKVAEKLQRT